VTDAGVSDEVFGVETIELDLPVLAGALSRRLHDAGVPVTPARSADLARALSLVRPITRRRLYWTARAVLVSDPGHVRAFDAVFFAVFGERGEDDFDPDSDDLLDEAIRLVVQTETASVSMIQRRLRVGYTRAGRLIDMLERRGVISGYEGSKPRQVLITQADLARVVGGPGSGSGGGGASAEPSPVGADVDLDAS